jgi:hypothetical protein
MNRAFDYNGVVVSKSNPVRKLQTLKKTLIIDSADRDTKKYFTNGDFVVYLPRVYENVVSIRLMAAEFPPILASTSPGALTHSYTVGQNVPSGTFSGDSAVSTAGSKNPYYFLVDIEGLNKTDECAVSGQRSTFADGTYAKIPVLIGTAGFIEYNDHSGQDNIAKYYPPLGKLDRFHIRTRIHSQQGNQGFIYWTDNGSYAASNASNMTVSDYSLTFEIEYLDNVFDDFSGLETRISERA